MLRKKEYTAILESAKSKDEIVALFNSLYSPLPAIRIVREIYHRNADREYEFSCDKCGHGFVVKAENDPEYNEELCVCPNCGHSISLMTNSYYSPKKLYALDEAYRGYQKVLASSGETVDPSFSVFETVEVEGKRYFIARRFHFKLKQGQINKTRIYRCLIIPEKREDNYAVLYENDIGDLTTSSTEKPGDWFSMYKYNTPGVGKSCMSKEVEKLTESQEDMADVLRAWLKLLANSKEYYSKPCVEMRQFFEKYPVDQVPKTVEEDKCYFENHGDYLAFRKFRECKNEVIERSRWIFSLKDDYSKLVVYRNERWSEEYDFKCYGFSDADFLELEEELRKTDIGKMGLYEYLDYSTRDDSCYLYGYYYLTALKSYPIIETLVKIGMFQLVGQICSDKIKVYPNSKHLWGKLGLSKENFEFAKCDQLYGDDFQKLLAINAYDPKVDADSFYRWINEYAKASSYSVGQIIENLGIDLKQVMDYLDSVYFDQGCECEEAISQWHDYIRNYELFYHHYPKTQEDKFPDSLKKAHDVMTMRNNAWSYEFNGVTKKFSQMMKKWKHLEFEDKRYKIIVPNTPKEISQEGARQHHCVAGYIRSVLDGQCLILFLRRKECEERPFLTIEYNMQGTLRQIRGKFNRSIREMTTAEQEKALIKFLNAWSKKTGISTGIKSSENAA